MGVSTDIQAVVLGRAGADLYPLQAAEEAARRGNAAGATVATRLAGSAAMPTSEEVDRLLAGGSVEDGVVKPPPPVPSPS